MTTLDAAPDDLQPISVNPEVSDPPNAPAKKRKKRKPKKQPAGQVAANNGSKAVAEAESKPPVLCISRNKHWRYISSYHGPWLQLPVELLESLLMLNLDPGSFNHSHGHDSKPSGSPISPNGGNARGNGRFYQRNVPHLAEHQLNGSPPETPLSYTLPEAKPNQAVPPPIDPGVFRSVTTIRRLIDEASDLAVRAASGLSAAALGSMRSGGGSIAYNGNNPWVTAQSLGLNPMGDQGGNGRPVAMSPTRVHRLRALAVNRLASAYKTDEIAASVMVMQGASALDDIAERVLKVEPNNVDAQYVHFFHEKIPSRQLAECTTTAVLDELIARQPQTLEYYRTRGVVRCFRDEYHLAIRDFTHALKEARNVRKIKQAHSGTGSHVEHRSTKAKKGKKGSSMKTTGQAPANGTTNMSDDANGGCDPPPIHPSLHPNAPEAIEPQLLFLRGAAYLQSAVFQIESTILKLEGVSKMTSADGAELRLCYIENGNYGGVELGGANGPLGAKNGEKSKAYREALATTSYRESVATFLRKSLRDHEKFLSHFDTLEASIDHGTKTEAEAAEFAFFISESARPGGGNSPSLPDMPPSTFTTYHPLLVESHFSILLCLLMLGDFNGLLLALSKAAALIDGLEGYPIFLPARSMAQAEFIEICERLSNGWRPGLQTRRFEPSSLVSETEKAPDTPSTAEVPTKSLDENDKVLVRSLEALRVLLAPVAKRQREREEETLQSGEKKKGPINIPLHGPRVEVILAWLGATHLVELENIA